MESWLIPFLFVVVSIVCLLLVARDIRGCWKDEETEEFYEGER
jgi:hypothetical protein